MLGIIIGLLSIYSIYLSIKGISACAKAEVWQPILDYCVIIITFILVLFIIGLDLFKICIEFIY
ncbi:hypothetical protein HGB13_00555 [bacterium]|nr:hypothetical protein [bacterium]